MHTPRSVIRTSPTRHIAHAKLTYAVVVADDVGCVGLIFLVVVSPRNRSECTAFQTHDTAICEVLARVFCSLC
jgi:hypothetical protein